MEMKRFLVCILCYGRKTGVGNKSPPTRLLLHLLVSLKFWGAPLDPHSRGWKPLSYRMKFISWHGMQSSPWHTAPPHLTLHILAISNWWQLLPIPRTISFPIVAYAPHSWRTPFEPPHLYHVAIYCSASGFTSDISFIRLFKHPSVNKKRYLLSWGLYVCGGETINK